jgi:cell wall-associated NlpC family hydrolase
MARHGHRVAANQLRPGDLIFFNTLGTPFSHVGIYVGQGRFAHAPSTGGRVRIVEIKQRYWSTRFSGARRLLGRAPAA